MESKSKKPIFLIILDGFGYSPLKNGNAIAKAKMPTWSRWLKKYPNTLLKASGEAVGLLPGFMGNSEVGHLTIGSGRVIKSLLKKIHESIQSGEFFNNKKLLDLFGKLKESGKALHLMGLLSDGGVHSHIEHLFALLDLAKKVGLKDVYIHAFLDGRDTLPTSAAKYLNMLDQKIKSVGIGKIASLHGRFYAMDRDHNWGRVEQSYKVLRGSFLPDSNINWQNVLDDSYKKGNTDEFVLPVLLDKDGYIKQGDGVLFFNFRPDRARELTELFINDPKIHLSFFLGMVCYKEEFKSLMIHPERNELLASVVEWVFEDDASVIQNTLLEVLAQNNKKVFVVAETEKYAHVTYFFNGMKEQKLDNETRILIPSVKAKNYIEHPEMSALEITKIILGSLKKDTCDFYLVNYANADMVGHSSDFEATVKACEILDAELKKLFDEVVIKLGGVMFITADHGNAEEKLDSFGNPKSAHTINSVPFMIVSKDDLHLKMLGNDSLGISAIAPSLLKFMGLSVPREMDEERIF